MLKDKVIDEIISRLIPLRTLYKEEIDTITNDLYLDIKNPQSIFNYF